MFFGRPKQALLQHAQSSYCVLNKFFTFILGSLAATLANADVCFETNGHDNTLRALFNEKGLFEILRNTCGVYNDQSDDCANYFTNEKKYGHGFFGGSTCTWNWHEINLPDPCVDQTLQANCKSGFGTPTDYLALAGIIIGSLLTLCCICVIAIRKKCPQTASDARSDGQYKSFADDSKSINVAGETAALCGAGLPMCCIPH